MQQNQTKLPVITKELLDALDELFPEKTPEINMEPKEMYLGLDKEVLFGSCMKN